MQAFRGVNVHGNIDRFQAIVPLHAARNQGHVKRGEIWMSVITCGSIHEDHEWFSKKTRFFCVWLFYYVSNFVDSRMEVPRYRSSPTS